MTTKRNANKKSLKRLRSFFSMFRWVKARSKTIFIFTILILSLFLILSNWSINHYSKPYISGSAYRLPSTQAALVLGTSRFLSNGQPNYYFKYRIEAAVQLYKSGRVKYFILSGDNSATNYNEPLYMKKELIKRGVPSNIIYLDYAGFRTLDSVVRSREIFSQDSIIIISQPFHLKRAIYIARRKGITAFGFPAKDISYKSDLKTRIRETFARAKVFIDLYFINKQPKFLGEKIQLGK